MNYLHVNFVEFVDLLLYQVMSIADSDSGGCKRCHTSHLGLACQVLTAIQVYH